MRYVEYFDTDFINGEGVRASLFISGCDLNCKGCFNKKAQNPNYGTLFTEEMKNKIFDDLGSTKINRDGLSLLGGDPLFSSNIKDVLELLKEVKERFPQKNIWLWSGYVYEEMNAEQLEVLKYVDVLVDGPFVQELKDLSLSFRGSSNQRIIRF